MQIARAVSPRLPVMLGLGFAFWLMFLLALEPNNIMRALNAGHTLNWSQETLRIICASLLGCSATPFLLEQVRRFPIEGTHWWRHAALQALFCLALATGLIAISCVLAKWWLIAEHRPLAQAFRQELMGNGPLVAFCLVAFTALLHGLRHRTRDAAGPPRHLTSVAISTRGQTTLIEVARIDWIETQGNYLALHAGSETHLIRGTLARLEARLDPARFVRVHRRILVAADRIATITSLGAGDAQLHLKDGTELRLSRTYRERIEAVMRMGRV